MGRLGVCGRFVDKGRAKQRGRPSVHNVPALSSPCPCPAPPVGLRLYSDATSGVNTAASVTARCAPCSRNRRGHLRVHGRGAGAAFYSQNLRPEACHGVFTPKTMRCFTVEVVNAGDVSGQATCHMTASKNVRTQPVRFGEDVRTPVLAPGQSAVVELRVALRPELKITLVRCLPGMLMSS